MSKLYTEEQVRKLLYQLSFTPSQIDDTIDSITPIKLPSDEKINDVALETFINDSKRFGFIEGAKWMRDKIKRGNNE
jgi:hypothetical protein